MEIDELGGPTDPAVAAALKNIDDRAQKDRDRDRARSLDTSTAGGKLVADMVTRLKRRQLPKRRAPHLLPQEEFLASVRLLFYPRPHERDGLDVWVPSGTSFVRFENNRFTMVCEEVRYTLELKDGRLYLAGLRNCSGNGERGVHHAARSGAAMRSADRRG
jgi:hypothetical protein